MARCVTLQLFLSKQMEAELQEVKKEIAATNQLLLAARRKFKADPQNTDAQADIEHFDKEIGRLQGNYNTLVTALATGSNNSIRKIIVQIKL